MRRVAAGVSAVVLGVAGVFVAAPAQAAENYANAVCNSDYSDAGIRVFSDYPGATYSYNLAAGQCVSRPWNGADNLRVDVEYPSHSVFGDIDSYKIGEIGVGWGPCHTGSENSASNPPDSYNANGIRYRNYSNSNCS